MIRHFLVIFGCLSTLLLTGHSLWAASPTRAMKEGIRAYHAKKYKEALTHFEAAEVEAPDDPKIRYNAAAARYRTGDFASAAKEFGQVLSKTEDPKLRAKAYYNLGNTAFREKDLKASSGFYRKALSIDPEDRQAKENLEFVLKAIKQQKQQKRKQNGKTTKNQAKPKEDQKTEPTQETRNSAQKEGTGKKSPQPTTGKNKEQKPPEGKIHETGGGKKKGLKGTGTNARPDHPVEGHPLSPEEAERLLNSLSDDQRAYFRKQAAREAPNRKNVVEDW
ncbi:MAG: tetratricopeptide repeat protein [Deltaproteobacteria bacterium]|nr:tetratricopeptide repeat protein [Deltaproteobacteria bacterium]